MSQFFTFLFGGSPVRTCIKLLLASLLVGLILSKLGWKLLDVLDHIWYFIFDKFFEMFLVGAVIVIPVFIIHRLLSGSKN